MVKIYVPDAKAVGEPPQYDNDLSWKEIEPLEEAYITRVVEWCKAKGRGNLRGVVYRLPVADGHATYVVFSTAPLQLLWLNLGDGYQMSRIEERGFRASDIRAYVQWRKEWNNL